MLRPKKLIARLNNHEAVGDGAKNAGGGGSKGVPPLALKGAVANSHAQTAFTMNPVGVGNNPDGYPAGRASMQHILCFDTFVNNSIEVGKNGP